MSAGQTGLQEGYSVRTDSSVLPKTNANGTRMALLVPARHTPPKIVMEGLRWHCKL
jgi:hypothetical protein